MAAPPTPQCAPPQGVGLRPRPRCEGTMLPRRASSACGARPIGSAIGYPPRSLRRVVCPPRQGPGAPHGAGGGRAQAPPAISPPAGTERTMATARRERAGGQESPPAVPGPPTGETPAAACDRRLQQSPQQLHPVMLQPRQPAAPTHALETARVLRARADRGNRNPPAVPTTLARLGLRYQRPWWPLATAQASRRPSRPCRTTAAAGTAGPRSGPNFPGRLCGKAPQSG
mmetsp:Transcript_135878/g.338876  ORF Transcript_135878/g.338876 Transcript_135878/m.338876 type:complete len:229 (+) Transcript_135878:407-1093(+)